MATPNDALPEIGLKIVSGTTSLGKFINFVITDKLFDIISNIPELLKHPTATNIPTSVGNIFTTVLIPSFAPTKNISNTFFFSDKPYNNIITIIAGTAILEI